MKRKARGNTPTSVGKTGQHISPKRDPEKHPHERGEDHESTTGDDLKLETPPRAWGRLNGERWTVEMGGNTPTSVGKTMSSAAYSSGMRKHPHERGEDVSY